MGVFAALHVRSAASAKPKKTLAARALAELSGLAVSAVHGLRAGRASVHGGGRFDEGLVVWDGGDVQPCRAVGAVGGVDTAAQATLRSRNATAPVLLWRPRDVAAGRPCSSAALRMVELLATRVAQHPMVAAARRGIDILDLGITREIPEETSQE